MDNFTIASGSEVELMGSSTTNYTLLMTNTTTIDPNSNIDVSNLWNVQINATTFNTPVTIGNLYYGRLL